MARGLINFVSSGDEYTGLFNAKMMLRNGYGKSFNLDYTFPSDKGIVISAQVGGATYFGYTYVVTNDGVQRAWDRVTPVYNVRRINIAGHHTNPDQNGNLTLGLLYSDETLF